MNQNMVLVVVNRDVTSHRQSCLYKDHHAQGMTVKRSLKNVFLDVPGLQKNFGDKSRLLHCEDK